MLFELDTNKGILRPYKLRLSFHKENHTNLYNQFSIKPSLYHHQFYELGMRQLEVQKMISNR